MSESDGLMDCSDTKVRELRAISSYNTPIGKTAAGSSVKYSTATTRNVSLCNQVGFLNIIIVHDVKQSLTLSGGEEMNGLQNSRLFLFAWTDN